jgi:CrcB protein
MARYWCSGLIARHVGETFPWGTLLVNVSGCLVIGFVAALTAPEGRLFVSSSARTFVMAGVCGGYTTFSSFSLQTLALAADRQWLKAGANCVLSLALCLAAVWLGHTFAAGLNRLKGS